MFPAAVDTISRRNQSVATDNRLPGDPENPSTYQLSPSILPLSMLTGFDKEEFNTQPNYTTAEDNSITIHNTDADMTSAV